MTLPVSVAGGRTPSGVLRTVRKSTRSQAIESEPTEAANGLRSQDIDRCQAKGAPADPDARIICACDACDARATRAVRGHEIASKLRAMASCVHAREDVQSRTRRDYRLGPGEGVWTALGRVSAGTAAGEASDDVGLASGT